MSSSSSSPLAKRRVSFDLLAEMAYAFPEKPLSPVLVEVVDGVTEEEEGGEGQVGLTPGLGSVPFEVVGVMARYPVGREVATGRF